MEFISLSINLNYFIINSSFQLNLHFVYSYSVNSLKLNYLMINFAKFIFIIQYYFLLSFFLHIEFLKVFKYLYYLFFSQCCDSLFFVIIFDLKPLVFFQIVELQGQMTDCHFCLNLYSFLILDHLNHLYSIQIDEKLMIFKI